MKDWSDNPVHEDFSIKIFFDTNLLVYLVDKTYKSLNYFVGLLNKIPFTRLVSSRYVIFEFAEVRKREHYMRIAVKNSHDSSRGNINYSSLLKYNKEFEHPKAIFEDEIPNIKKEVEKEIKTISNNYGIDFEFSVLHEDQIKPSIDVCLSSKITNHDALVLVSAAFPQPGKTENTILLTNDKSFHTEHSNENVQNILQNDFIIPPPDLYPTRDFHNGLSLTGKKCSSNYIIKKKLLDFLTIQIKEKLKSNYIGKTFNPIKDDFPENCLCFKAPQNKIIKNNKYVTIIGKSLDFIYSIQTPVDFWNNGSSIGHNFTPSDDNSNISFLIPNIDENGESIDSKVIDELKSDGNLIFYHPDND